MDTLATPVFKSDLIYRVDNTNYFRNVRRVRIMSKLFDDPVGFVPAPMLRLCIAFFAVAEGLLLLDMG